MPVSIRDKRMERLSVGGKTYEVEIIEIPFREGVELRCEIDGEEFRVSDRQLGEREAFRILREEIEKRQQTAGES